MADRSIIGSQQQQPPPQARGTPADGMGTAPEHPLALQACTWSNPTPLAHSLEAHMPTVELQRSAWTTLPTLITCWGKIEHFQITL